MSNQFPCTRQDFVSSEGRGLKTEPTVEWKTARPPLVSLPCSCSSSSSSSVIISHHQLSSVIISHHHHHQHHHHHHHHQSSPSVIISHHHHHHHQQQHRHHRRHHPHPLFRPLGSLISKGLLREAPVPVNLWKMDLALRGGSTAQLRGGPWPLPSFWASSRVAMAVAMGNQHCSQQLPRMAVKESLSLPKQTLAALAQQWEHWATNCAAACKSGTRAVKALL